MDVIRRKARTDGDSSRNELSQLRLICLQYEKTIIELQHTHQTNLENKDRDISRAIGNRKKLQANLTAMTTANAELNNTYSRGRAAHNNFLINEETLNASLKQHQYLLREEERRYQVLESNSCEVGLLAKAVVNQRKSTSTKENEALQNELERLKLKNQSLESLVKQKNGENEELTKICDELIGNTN